MLYSDRAVSDMYITLYCCKGFTPLICKVLLPWFLKFRFFQTQMYDTLQCIQIISHKALVFYVLIYFYSESYA